MRRRSYHIEAASLPKYKYSFNDHTFDLNLSTSLDNKTIPQKGKQTSLQLHDKIKSNSNFTLDKLITRAKPESLYVKPHLKASGPEFKLPTIRRREVQNPQAKTLPVSPIPNAKYYLGRVAKAFENKQNTYLISLARQHYLQTLQALKVGKTLSLPNPQRDIKLPKKNPRFKTVCLDLDETLIHCDENSNNYTVKLDFPMEGGTTISAGVRIRPHCQDFLRELSSFAQIIIFTASSSSYADVVLNHLDPQKRYISHRLYRQHCTLQQGYYTKDLRCINRRLEDMVLVDNSGFCFMIQPQNGIPVLPFYHFAKDKELLILLEFLKDVLKSDDVRTKLKNYFFWHKFVGDSDPKKVFTENIQNVK